MWQLFSYFQFAFQIVGDSIAFALGLATTLALLGIAASFAGKAYGQIGQGLPLAASGLAVVMGLNLLEVDLLLPFVCFSIFSRHNYPVFLSLLSCTNLT